ncbi:MAG: DUF6282 family protein [Bryobacteraceae bacterium]
MNCSIARPAVFAVTLALMAATTPALAQTLEGAVDMHTHSSPDGTPRKLDAIDLAKLAKSKGMRALVLKNHYEPTASLAYIVRKVVPGIELFGGISLDRTVGGVNPAAVEWMTKVSGGYGKVVWMPTFDSEYVVKTTKENRPFVRVSENGKLLPEVIQVISIIAKNNLVLETGHVAPAEVLMILAEGKRQGVRNMLVTHATNEFPGLSVAQLKEAAKLGAYLEFVWSGAQGGKFDAFAKAIRKAGPEWCVISSDLGQPPNPLHTDGLMELYRGLLARGFTLAEVDRMSKTNPAKLLGLP